MADQVLKDKQGRKIAAISTASNGVQTIKDAQGRKKGTYDPKSNTTKDAQGRYWESADHPSVVGDHGPSLTTGCSGRSAARPAAEPER